MLPSTRLVALTGLLFGAADGLSTRDFSDLDLMPTTQRVGGDVALRLMPLGTSVTYGGDSSTTSNSYRSTLRQLLVSDGNPVDMVGTRQHGSMSDNDVEAWPGLRVDELFQTKIRTAVPEYLPNLVLIHAGTDDCVQGYELDAFADRVLEMMQFVWKQSIKSSIVLSTLLPNRNETVEACVLGLNEQLRTLVEEQQAISKKVVIVDFHSEEGLAVEELADDSLLPTSEGYEHMAQMWFAGIEDAASRGWLEKPEEDPTPAPSPTDDEPGAASPTGGSGDDVEEPDTKENKIEEGEEEGSEDEASGSEDVDSSSGDDEDTPDAVAEEAEGEDQDGDVDTAGAASLGVSTVLVAATVAGFVLAMM